VIRMKNEQLVENLKLENEKLRQLNSELMLKNNELITDNMKLNDTVDWMHDLIWDTFKRLRSQDKSKV